MVKVVVLFVHDHAIAKFSGQSVDVDLVSQSIVLPNQESDWNVGWNILQVDIWWREATVAAVVRCSPSIIELNEFLLLNNLAQVKQLLCRG